MLVREMLRARTDTPRRDEVTDRLARLPHALPREGGGARTAILQRLSASRTFFLGQRAGALRSAQAQSGRPFRLDVRQRVIVKALVSRHAGTGAARGAALARHVAYLGRLGAGVEAARAEFFDQEADGLDGRALTAKWSEDHPAIRPQPAAADASPCRVCNISARLSCRGHAKRRSLAPWSAGFMRAGITPWTPTAP